MVLDVVESVRLMEQDEHDFIQRWHYFVEQVREQVLPQHGGRMHKSLGDGLMLEFADATGCVKASFAMLDICRQGNDGRPASTCMHLRVGAHLAEFVSDQHDIYGTDVNLTARIATLAGPGQTVVTAGLRDQLTAGLDADIEDLGECHLKHVSEPVRAYRVGPVGSPPASRVVTSMPLDIRPTIAVVPFSIRSAERGHEMLGEALADELIAALSRTADLRVISRLSTTAFTSRSDAVEDIRSHLKANYILSGTCRSDGSQFSLFVELIDARAGHVIWADNLRGTVARVFAPDDELISRLIATISSTVMAQELQRVQTQSLPTLEGYSLLLGSVALMHRTQFSQFDRARQMLEHLIDRSPRHPVPYAWLAKWHVLRASQGWSVDPQSDAAKASELTKRALDNDPNCSLALTMDGLVKVNLLRDFATGETTYARALDVNPNDSLAWLLKGMMHAFKGEGQAASGHVMRANALSPLDPLRYFYEALTVAAFVSNRQYDDAIEVARSSLRHNTTHASTYRSLLLAQSLAGKLQDAQQTLVHLNRIEPGFNVAHFASRYPGRDVAPEYTRFLCDALAAAGVPLT